LTQLLQTARHFASTRPE